MEKILAILNLFRKGAAVADKESWKKGQIGATVIGALIIAIAQAATAFGYPLPIPEELATQIGAAVIGVVNFVLTYITSESVGLLPEKQEDTAQ